MAHLRMLRKRWPPLASDFGRDRPGRKPSPRSAALRATIVRPGECDRPARAFLERSADVHCREFRLTRFALSDAVRARLGEQQRPVTGDMLKTRKVRTQLGLAMQVQVERTDIKERQIEKFGRWKVDVREEADGRAGLCRVVEVTKEIPRSSRGRASA
jgi:hypothetical protein